MATAQSNLPATSPSAVHAVLEDVFRRGDIDAFLALHEPDATVRTPPNGDIAHGHRGDPGSDGANTGDAPAPDEFRARNRRGRRARSDPCPMGIARTT